MWQNLHVDVDVQDVCVIDLEEMCAMTLINVSE